MSQKKKKGFFSWFGLGGQSRSDTTSETQIDNQTESSVDESENIESNDTYSQSIITDNIEESQSTSVDDSSNSTMSSDITSSEELNDICITITEASIEQDANTPLETESNHPNTTINNEFENDNYPPSSSVLHLKENSKPDILDSDNKPTDIELELIDTDETIETDNSLDAQTHTPENLQDFVSEEVVKNKKGFFTRLKESLVKTKQNIGSGFLSLFSGKRIDADLFEELEEQLLIADVGVETTNKIIKNLTEHATKNELKDAGLLYDKLKDEMSMILKTVSVPLEIAAHKPFVILMVGVNGVGKTTTIGKLAKQFQANGKTVMLAAGDTFRAAAVEQLQVWGQRNDIQVIAQHTGADSASVIFDALEAAKARKVDILIADTAGRLQNKSHLMDELKKIVRVMKKQDPEAPHEIMLTLDACTGQNAISQAQLFDEAVGLTGLTLTKLDGTAKGGVIFALADKFNIPVRYIGVGEKIDDLRPFNGDEFVNALFDK
ncbi:signal recognition particle-docking protein FtsY [Thorsellia anophelis]|uniref:Signal recognition particle receptor FtsY n=1 Tax=Thorsellia anophelis DSM 18579 TaxID=1123402 RepID=A0A1I0A7Z4_9GAMM|nr:signal recognition particle-docking protein FtsY [Thorsellia anophelis]SES90108.1 fused signal recognition particle receptor [Thorsellia anophelis DSM 18579]